jgi:hypothetical protein
LLNRATALYFDHIFRVVLALDPLSFDTMPARRLSNRIFPSNIQETFATL